jgi:hypothetical protein
LGIIGRQPNEMQPLGIGDLGKRLVDLAQRDAQPDRQMGSELGRRHAAEMAAIERYLKAALEVARGAVKGGLGDAEMSGGGAERAMLRDRDVVAHLGRRQQTDDRARIDSGTIDFADMGNALFDLAQHARDAAMQQLAGLCAHAAAGTALEQPGAGLGLQLRQRVAHRRLGQSEMPRRRAGRAAAHDGIEHHQTAKIGAWKIGSVAGHRFLCIAILA